MNQTVSLSVRPARRPLRWLLILLGILFGLAVIGIIAFVIIWSNPYPPHAVAQAAMQSTANVTVSDQSDEIVFMPKAAPTTGFIFYPGALVSAAAYAPIMHAIAEKGYAVFVIKLPLNFALLAINRAGDIIAANPSIIHWAVGGHSLGGVAASFYADNKPPAVTGLILFAAYPNNDMSKDNLHVVSISGSNDGLATPDKIAASKKLLPADTTYVEIKGGDHAQFADYGPQSGDNPATTSQADQFQQTDNASVALLTQLAR